MNRFRLVVPAALALAVTACSQEGGPSEQVKKAGEDIVKAVEGSSPAPVQADGPYAPRNECGELPGSQAFLAELDRAIVARDEDALVALAAEDVKLDFGGGSGTDELRRRLTGEPGNLWTELEELAALGCAVNAVGGITMPWYFAQDLPVDSYSGAIVTGEDVPVRSAPGSDAPIVAALSWDAVEIAADQQRLEGWTPVRLPAAEPNQPREGYIASDKLRSLLDHRLIAASRNGRWRITSLVAGD